MTTLNRYANGDTNYVAKLDADMTTIETALNALQTALGTLGGGGGSVGQLLNALFGPATAIIGNTSYTQATAGTIITIAGGYAWRPDLGNVLAKAGATAIDFTGQAAATYYIVVGADGTPARSSSSVGALYSVVWTGAAFGAITAIAPVLPGGDVTGNYQSLSIQGRVVAYAPAAGSVDGASMAGFVAGRGAAGTKWIKVTLAADTTLDGLPVGADDQDAYITVVAGAHNLTLKNAGVTTGAQMIGRDDVVMTLGDTVHIYTGGGSGVWQLVL